MLDSFDIMQSKRFESEDVAGSRGSNSLLFVGGTMAQQGSRIPDNQMEQLHNISNTQLHSQKQYSDLIALVDKIESSDIHLDDIQCTKLVLLQNRNNLIKRGERATMLEQMMVQEM